MTTLASAATTAASGGQERRRINWLGILAWVFLGVLIFITIFPFWWVLRTALTDPQAIFRDVGSLLPTDTTLQNFERVLGLVDPTALVGQQATNVSAATLNFPLFLRNSIIVSGLITLGQTFFCALAGYSFARLRFPFRDTIFFFFLTGLMVPGIVLFLPNYVLIRQLGWIDTFQGIVAPGFLMTPFAVFFIRQFFLSLNKDLEEAAKLDGVSPLGMFWRVALPLVQGPLLTLALLTFIGSWNEYFWPFIVGRKEEVRVLTVALGIFRSQTPQGAPDWSGLMAGTVVSVMPTVLLFIFFGRRVVDSIQFSGFK